MQGILAAEFTELLERQFFFHFLLVALGMMCDTTTHRTLHLGHVFLDLAHMNISIT